MQLKRGSRQQHMTSISSVESRRVFRDHGVQYLETIRSIVDLRNAIERVARLSVKCWKYLWQPLPDTSANNVSSGQFRRTAFNP